MRSAIDLSLPFLEEMPGSARGFIVAQTRATWFRNSLRQDYGITVLLTGLHLTGASMVNQAAGHGARARDAFAVDEMAARAHELFFPRTSPQIRRCAGGANTYVTADILAPSERICTELWTRRHLSG